MSVEVDATNRFSDRVRDYIAYRPSYPVAVVQTLEREAGISPSRTRVVDLGSGTGISATLFLNAGYAVVGVEPNAEMRGAAESLLVAYSQFQSLNGQAESVPLPDNSCELIVAAQAFHWFNTVATRQEMQRLLAPDGLVALIWNERQLDSTPFLQAYEAVLRKYGTDYDTVAKTYPTTAEVEAFFGAGHCTNRVFPSFQSFDCVGLRGRALASSYVPSVGASGHEEFVAALHATFTSHSVAGGVRFEYNTRLHFGQLG